MGLAEKLLADGERPLVVLRPHARRLARPALVLLVLAPAAAFAAGAVPAGPARAPVRLVVTALAALIAVRWVIWPFLLWWNTLYVVTDERFFERAGLVRRTGHDLPLQGVSDVIVAQSFGERLLRSGTLRVITDGGAEVVVHDVPAISRVQRSLLAVADDITERLRAPRRWAEEADDLADPRAGAAGPFDEPGVDDDRVEQNRVDEDWVEQDRFDEEAPAWHVPSVPDRAEARRREREARRRLAEIQDRMRRAPAPDSPLEDGGDDERTRPVDVRAPVAENEDPPGDEHDPPPSDEHDDPPAEDAGGARILRFPPRP